MTPLRNTIIISVTILLTATFLFYQNLSESHARKVCVGKIYKINARMGKEFEEAVEQQIQEWMKNKKPFPSSSQDIRKTRKMAELAIQSLDDQEESLNFGRANFLYRSCLAEHGMKPEDLVK